MSVVFNNPESMLTVSIKVFQGLVYKLLLLKYPWCVYSADVKSAHVAPFSNYPNRIVKESPVAKISMDETLCNPLLSRDQSLYLKFSGQNYQGLLLEAQRSLRCPTSIVLPYLLRMGKPFLYTNTSSLRSSTN